MLESLHRTGAALGIIEDLSIGEHTISLGSKDLLLLYTDGLQKPSRLRMIFMGKGDCRQF